MYLLEFLENICQQYFCTMPFCLILDFQISQNVLGLRSNRKGKNYLFLCNIGQGFHFFLDVQNYIEKG